MIIIRGFLSVIFISLLCYTGFVVSNYGWGKLPIYFGDLIAFNWNGQFNLDLLGYLGLSALWVAWRHKFSVAGLLNGVLASFFGMLYFAPYVLWQSLNAHSISALILGDNVM